jgi:hypothetical protein
MGPSMTEGALMRKVDTSPEARDFGEGKAGQAGSACRCLALSDAAVYTLYTRADTR